MRHTNRTRRWTWPEWLRTLVGGMISASLCAGLSLSAMSLAVLVVLDLPPDRTSLAVITVGAAIGTGTGTWYAQPVVTRLVAALCRRG